MFFFFFFFFVFDTLAVCDLGFVLNFDFCTSTYSADFKFVCLTLG